jgi:U6 snRNA-associated Sm-like protein LSm1
VVLLGEIVRIRAPRSRCIHVVDVSSQDLDQEDDVPLQQVDYSVLDPYHKRDIAHKKAREDFKSKVLYEQKGFCKEGGEGDGY